MGKVKVSQSKMNSYATTFGDCAEGLDYYPLKDGNMPYSQSNSINALRENILQLVISVENFGNAAQQDAIRIKQMGEAFAEKDKDLSGHIQLEVK
ncbi:DUF3130 family protein [Listeria costaricensis]|uniref:DUF3130 family protein n=1 Tax=Listeria costaricensis TaxID=2026604 RepID=UPI000C07E9F9|nr:DUF3130 family protein [Listeria costaricensis]